MNKKRMIFTVLGLMVACLAVSALVIQLIPYGRDHTNPPVVREPNWDSPQTRELAKRACFDCHSNETVWPWYTNVAPSSWLVTFDVERGREKVNFSEWGMGGEEEDPDEADEFSEVVMDGEMPPRIYLLMHPEAVLTGAEKQALAGGLEKTVSSMAGRK